MSEYQVKIRWVPLENYDETLADVVKLMNQNRHEWQRFMHMGDMLRCLFDPNTALLQVNDGEAYLLFEAVQNPRGVTYINVIWSNGSRIVCFAEDLVKYLRTYGRGIGASYIEMNGRKPWAKVLEPQGFETASVKLIKEI